MQILEKHYDPTTRKLSSVTLSDGAFVSSNVVPKDDKAAENLNRIDRFALVQIDQARVKCDKLVVDEVDILEISSKGGEVINLTGVSITHFAGRLPPFKILQFSANL